jgi:hypothetical protein
MHAHAPARMQRQLQLALLPLVGEKKKKGKKRRSQEEGAKEERK